MCQEGSSKGVRTPVRPDDGLQGCSEWEEGDREGQVQDDVVLEPHLWGLDLILKATEKPLKFLVCLF